MAPGGSVRRNFYRGAACSIRRKMQKRYAREPAKKKSNNFWMVRWERWKKEDSNVDVPRVHRLWNRFLPTFCGMPNSCGETPCGRGKVATMVEHSASSGRAAVNRWRPFAPDGRLRHACFIFPGRRASFCLEKTKWSKSTSHYCTSSWSQFRY